MNKLLELRWVSTAGDRWMVSDYYGSPTERTDTYWDKGQPREPHVKRRFKVGLAFGIRKKANVNIPDWYISHDCLSPGKEGDPELKPHGVLSWKGDAPKERKEPEDRLFDAWKFLREYNTRVWRPGYSFRMLSETGELLAWVSGLATYQYLFHALAALHAWQPEDRVYVTGNAAEAAQYEGFPRPAAGIVTDLAHMCLICRPHTPVPGRRRRTLG